MARNPSPFPPLVPGLTDLGPVPRDSGGGLLAKLTGQSITAPRGPDADRARLGPPITTEVRRLIRELEALASRDPRGGARFARAIDVLEGADEPTGTREGRIGDDLGGDMKTPV